MMHGQRNIKLSTKRYDVNTINIVLHSIHLSVENVTFLSNKVITRCICGQLGGKVAQVLMKLQNFGCQRDGIIVYLPPSTPCHEE